MNELSRKMFYCAMRVAMLDALPEACRKIRHADWDAAAAHIAALRLRSDCVEPESLWAYRCHCGGIHVGHDRRFGGQLPEVEP